ncbi:UTP15 C terminal-domain-containing protein [Podospora didyma]|uniref:UTP15 C terminal-domain-containing protein n=1 Tax=Podospora didyma TaxID=330526 RepID=A0AAE0JY37_9PEZI|nr:UTP15 C terminal-domain-containing protein [Podospora didyma]
MTLPTRTKKPATAPAPTVATGSARPPPVVRPQPAHEGDVWDVADSDYGPILVRVVVVTVRKQKLRSSARKSRKERKSASWPISHISFPAASSPTTSNSLREPLKTIGRFDSEAHCGEIRADGRVLVAGEGTGKMQVFDVGGGTRVVVLKTWHVHKQPVWVTKWSPTELTTLMSASDDKTVRLWDLPSNNPSRMLTGHSDYVRFGAFMPGGNSNLLVSGSYDETPHEGPVEDVLPMPSGTTLLAAAGNAISVLDLVAAKPLRLITNHQKTVTCLSLASNETRVVSGNLDRHVKVFETSGWNVASGSKYPSPILFIAVISASATQEDRHLAVGMQSSMLSLRTQLSGSAADKARDRAAKEAARDIGSKALDKLDAKRAKLKRKAVSSKTMAMLGESIYVIIPTETTNSAGGRARRGGTPSLDEVIDMSRPEYQPVVALTVLIALRHRSALGEALEGRDEVTVLPLLRWAAKYIADPRYVSVCVDVGFHLLDIYSQYVGGSSELADQFRSLCGKVSKEVEKAQLAISTSGMVESLMIGRIE